MARPLRVEYPGAFYHVINRGNNQENIFKSNRDKEKFLDYLDKASPIQSKNGLWPPNTGKLTIQGQS
jgi:hypothetical protein